VAEGLMRRLVILGSTGSIGRAALDVVRSLQRAGEEIAIVGLSGHRNVSLLAEQVRDFHPEAVAVAASETAPSQGAPGGDAGAPAATALQAAAPEWHGEVLVGAEGLISLAAECNADLVLVAVEGIAGLRPTLAALGSGADVALATKEVLVGGGSLVTDAAVRSGRRLLPVDSEHSAIFQCLSGQPRGDVARLWLTASGGPFRRSSLQDMAAVTPRDALRHPTWKMGRKVTVDSATLMNKGLEIIEAHWLFGVAPERIEVVVHPQSIVHSCVEFVDGSILAQMGPRDMRLAIQYALTYPRRRPAAPTPLDLRTLSALEFEPPDPERFPCLGYAREALMRGGTAPVALNAANEVAVHLFLDGRIGFTDIARLVRRVVDGHSAQPASSLETVLAADREARADAETYAACGAPVAE
jgi:1-deoxy-D-xylulose-5-phosphate reductoisomerase